MPVAGRRTNLATVPCSTSSPFHAAASPKGGVWEEIRELLERAGFDVLDRVRSHVPRRDDRLLTFGPERAERARVEVEVPARCRFEAQPARGQDA